MARAHSREARCTTQETARTEAVARKTLFPMLALARLTAAMAWDRPAPEEERTWELASLR
jgi:hypothetical protein